MALALKVEVLWAALIAVLVFAWHRAREADRRWEAMVDEFGWGEDHEWAG